MSPLRFSLLCLATVACSNRVPSAPKRDGGTQGSPQDDTDRDGLCNGTEASRGTDPESTDSDADGFSDLMEESLLTDPTLANDPAPESVVRLAVEGGEVRHFVAVPVNDAIGANYRGSMTPLEPLVSDGSDPLSYLVGARALSAEPSGSVAAVREEQQEFVSVRGDTTLLFEVVFSAGPDTPPLACRRALPFAYVVKRADGVVVAQTDVVVVIEPDANPETPWCTLEPCL